MGSRIAAEAPWLAEGEEKRRAVQGIFSDIAPRYDLLNSILSFRLHYRWRKAAVRMLRVRPGETALDLCCGTGDFMRALQHAGAKPLGLDFCASMLQVARAKGLSHLSQGDACRMPIQSGTLDLVTVGWGIRNVADIDLAHREIVRVLKPGGRFVSLDTALPSSKPLAAASRFAFGVAAPLAGSLFGNRRAYTYLPRSTERFWGRNELAESMRRAGLEDVGWKDFFLGNVCAHYGRKP